uniref:Transmembrane protein n=1 Tax=Cucumis melo TaxID=3656 RepID=A0A9I9DBU7_CUCME
MPPIIKSLISIALLALLLLSRSRSTLAVDHDMAPNSPIGMFQMMELHKQVVENENGYQYSFEQKVVKKRARRSVKKAEGPSPSMANRNRMTWFDIKSLLCLCIVFGLLMGSE